MKKYFNMICISVLMILAGNTVLKASIVDELNYVNEKSDLYFYMNFSSILNFLSGRGIDLNDLNSLVMDESDNDTGRIINNFGIKISDLNEFLIVMNTIDIDKKSGYLVFISIKNGSGIIPEEFRKSSVKLKSGTAYKISAEEDMVFTIVDDFFVIGPALYVDAYLQSRSAKKRLLSARSSIFSAKTSSQSFFFQLTMSEYLKGMINNTMNAGTGMARGLKENVFIQTLLSLESVDAGIEISEKIKFQMGMQGSKPEDSERLQMICHTWIVGSSLIVSFADLIAARSGEQTLNELTSDQKLMSWMQKAFGRIHVRQENKGVVMSFEMTSAETDLMVSFIKKEIEKAKKNRAERKERDKISRLTLAISENNYNNVEKILKEKYNLNGFDNDGNTPLGAASAAGNVKIARLLIEKGAGLDIQNIDRLTPLHQAVRAANKEMIVFLLEKGSNVNAKADANQTALHYNAMQGNSEITVILIAKGASVNAADDDASTPLHYAASAGYIEIVKILADKKADPNLLNISQQRAIDVAFQNNQSEVVEFMKTRFKQEPKSFSGDDGNYNDDSNMEDDSTSGTDDPVMDEGVE